MKVNNHQTLEHALKLEKELHEIARGFTYLNSQLNEAVAHDVDGAEDAQASLEDLEACVNVTIDNIRTAISEYASEPCHTESLETTGRV